MAGLVLEEVPEGGGERLYPKDIVNHLLLVWAIDYIEKSPTKFNDCSDPKKPCDVVVVDAVDLDQFDENGSPGLLGRRTWWRQGRLIQKLKTRVGRPAPILARMTRVSVVGANPPFELVDMMADATCVVRANNWWAAHQDFVPSEPFTPGSPGLAVSDPSALEAAAQAALGGGSQAAGQQSYLERMASLGGGFQDGPPPF